MTLAAPRFPRLRHPVVLAHGLLGFARWAVGDVVLASYFRGIPEMLAAAGNGVLIPAVPATGSIVRRAEALAAAIRRDAPGERVHVIAHSMGGLDARHALTHLGLAGQVLSLTTLGTPHRGTPVADRGTDLADRAGILARLPSVGMDVAAYRDLRTDACAAFNAATPDVPGVRYASFAGAKPRADTIVALRWTHDLIAAAAADAHAVEADDAIAGAPPGANDGLVPVPSARWGTSFETVPADHFDLVGWTPVVSGPLGRPVDVAALWRRFLAPAAAVEE